MNKSYIWRFNVISDVKMQEDSPQSNHDSTKLPPLFIDGSNVAWNYGSKEKGDKPLIKNILTAAEAATEKGFTDIWVFLDANLVYETEDKDLLTDLQNKFRIEKTPAGTDADSFIIEYAKKSNGYILSNDRFKDYIERHQDYADFINGHRVTFMVNQELGAVLRIPTIVEPINNPISDDQQPFLSFEDVSKVLRFGNTTEENSKKQYYSTIYSSSTPHLDSHNESISLPLFIDGRNVASCYRVKDDTHPERLSPICNPNFESVRVSQIIRTQTHLEFSDYLLDRTGKEKKHYLESINVSPKGGLYLESIFMIAKSARKEGINNIWVIYDEDFERQLKLVELFHKFKEEFNLLKAPNRREALELIVKKAKENDGYFVSFDSFTDYLSEHPEDSNFIDLRRIPFLIELNGSELVLNSWYLGNMERKRYCLHVLGLNDPRGEILSIYEDIDLESNSPLREKGRVRAPHILEEDFLGESKFMGTVSHLYLGSVDLKYWENVADRCIGGHLIKTINSIAVAHGTGSRYSSEICHRLQDTWSKSSSFLQFYLNLNNGIVNIRGFLRAYEQTRTGVLALSKLSPREKKKIHKHDLGDLRRIDVEVPSEREQIPQVYLCSMSDYAGKIPNEDLFRIKGIYSNFRTC